MIAETLLGGISAAVKWTTGHPSMDRALGWLVAPTVSGVDVTDNSALAYSAVWAATRLLSGTGACLPLNLYRRLDGGGKELATDHSLFRILHDAPNDEMSSMMFRSLSIAHQINAGNCYAEIERTGRALDAAGRGWFFRATAVAGEAARVGPPQGENGIGSRPGRSSC